MRFSTKMTTCIGLMTMCAQSELQGKKYAISILMQGPKSRRVRVPAALSEPSMTVLEHVKTGGWHCTDTVSTIAALRMDTSLRNHKS